MYVVFILENCPYCKNTQTKLEKFNLSYKTIYFTQSNKLESYPLITHCMILSKYNKELTEEKYREYVAALKNNNNEKSKTIRQNVLDSAIFGKYTFPQIFIVDNTFTEKLNNKELVYTDDIKYVGTYDQLNKELKE